MLVSQFLRPLKSGAEASPFADDQWGVVYKLFPLHTSGGLGKTFTVEPTDDTQGLTLNTRDAILSETLEKLTVLSASGATPTEIVGLSDQGDYLIAKQPLEQPHIDYEADRQLAAKAVRAVPCHARTERSLWVIWHEEQPFFISDLHAGNIMRDFKGAPTVIDALVCPIPDWVLVQSRAVNEAVEDAKVWHRTGTLPLRKAFDDVPDEEL